MSENHPPGPTAGWLEGFLVEVADGEISTSAPFNDEMTLEELLEAHVNARGLHEIPVPEHPFPDTTVVGYCAPPDDEWEREPNVRMPDLSEPIRGPVVIAGIDAGGNYRFLTFNEATVYTLVEGSGELPLLQLKDTIQMPDRD